MLPRQYTLDKEMLNIIYIYSNGKGVDSGNDFK